MDAIFGWGGGAGKKKAKAGKAKKPAAGGGGGGGGGAARARAERAAKDAKARRREERKRRKLERMGVVLPKKKRQRREEAEKEEAGKAQKKGEAGGDMVARLAAAAAAANPEAEAGAAAAAAGPQKGKKKPQKKKKKGKKAGNPYLEEFRQWEAGLPADMARLLDESLPDERRAELFDLLPFEMPERYSWAVPDERALRALGAFGPLVEVGCGNGYWGRLLAERGVDHVGYDRKANGRVRKGGPEVLRKHADRALFLCYPDDFEESGESLAMRCLEAYEGDTVCHAGELLGDTVQENPWGKTTGADFQQHLAADFHLVLRVPLPSWPGSNDSLTVWRRTPRCQVDDINFRSVPAAERIVVRAAAPAYAHLLEDQ